MTISYARRLTWKEELFQPFFINYGYKGHSHGFTSIRSQAIKNIPHDSISINF